MNNRIEIISLADERIALINKKSTDGLSASEHQQLSRLNERMDVLCPRYTAQDWALLNKAQDIIKKLENNK